MLRSTKDSKFSADDRSSACSIMATKDYSSSAGSTSTAVRVLAVPLYFSGAGIGTVPRYLTAVNFENSNSRMRTQPYRNRRDSFCKHVLRACHTYLQVPSGTK